jgi:branched-chain amino acid aminotransferase
MDRLILHNDRIIPIEEVHLSPLQAGLLTGLGVFTTLRLYRGQPFRFDLHWHRVARDARRLEIPLCFEEPAVRRAIVRLAAVNNRQEGAVRVSFIKNSGGLWTSPPDCPPTDLLAFTYELRAWPAVHRLRMQPMAIFAAGIYSGTKMLSWAPNTALFDKARADGFDDALLLNERGQLVECTSANVFLVRVGQVSTPPLSSGCLAGVTRSILFEIAPTVGVRIIEQDLTPEDLASAQECFVSSTTRQVAAVGHINPGWDYSAPGPVTRALEEAFARYVADAGGVRVATAEPGLELNSDTRP